MNEPILSLHCLVSPWSISALALRTPLDIPLGAAKAIKNWIQHARGCFDYEEPVSLMLPALYRPSRVGDRNTAGSISQDLRHSPTW